ncbi:S1C family serine protease [Nocardioides marmorisolisilvae]|uniref:PDZ domain-containing protein n=1 Tax=Nocardioides marmorisolisilvae TaxID=1542737 RepID=A0A3N0DNS5_9ACTN|nr:trypsin-like peptidase domain-containing protein [Nocardioides marmorisolisilvae]RNL77300.1 PDZ domain-containing protein [Nocardioides marmorisolisilvae]
MSDTDFPGSSADQSGNGDEPTTPIETGPAETPAALPNEPAPTEPTTPLPGFAPPTPPPAAPSYPPPAYQPPAYEPPAPAYQPPAAPAYQPPAYQEPAYAPPPTQPPAYPAQYGVAQPTEPSAYPLPPTTTETSTPEKSRLPGWTWPLIAVLSLLLGIGGGAIGASLVNDDNASSGGDTVVNIPVRKAPLKAGNQSVAAVAAKLLPSTVQIVAEYKGRAQGATGSGFVFDDKGHIITNNHVVADAAADKGPIDVIDQSGTHHKATVVGRSPVYDLAVLKVEGAEKLQPVAFGSAAQMQVGETVVAVGSPLALSATVTSGIVSAKNRPVTTGDGNDASFINAVQTDAAINPGNSGGPLANLQGQVIGVNSAIASIGSSDSSGESANIGVGFAIPIEQVLVTAGQILRTGHAEYPVIGVSVRGTENNEGAEVKEINAGTPAAKSDLKVGDIITAVDDHPVTGQTDVVVAIRSHQAGDTVTLTVKRGSKTLKIKVGLLAKTG